MKIDTIKSGGQSQGGLDNAGGTLSGPLLLSRDPQVPMEAATKRYVDTALSNLSASNVVSGTLPIARLPAFSGDITSEAGSNNMVLSNTGIALGEYGKIVVDAKGRATNGTGLGNSDIPNFDFSKITTDKPTTLAGYGITDGVSLAGGAMTGPLVLSGSPVSGDNLVPKQYIDGMVNTLSASKTGDVIRKAYATTPTGFLKCNGAEVSKTTYADLYAVIGESNNSYNVVGSGQPWCQQYEINKLQSVSDIGPWGTGTALPVALTYSSTIVTKNRVYLFGGYNGTSWISTIYTAPINTDGTLGSWSTSGTLPMAWGVQKAVIIKNKVYLLGGYTSGTTTTNNIALAFINSDGTIGTFTNIGTLPGTLGWSQCIVTNSRIYLVAGYNQANSLSSVIYSAPLNSDGSLGTWVTETPFPVSVGAGSIAIVKNKVYYFGGVVTFPSTATNNIYVANINNDGTLGTWNLSSSVLPVALSVSQIFVSKSRVYIITGALTSSTVTGNIYSAVINADGTLGTWETQSGAISTGYVGGQLIVTNSRIYSLGGHTAAGTPTSTVSVANVSGGLNDYSAYYEDTSTNYMMPGSGKPWEQQYQLNATQSGDITGWTAGTAIPGPFMGTQAVVTKNRVYLLGGGNGTVVTSTVYTTTINADGTLGTWITTTSLPGILSNCQLIVTKNRVYVLGGLTASGSPTSVVYTAQINSDGTLGSWATGTSLPSVLSHSQAIVTKNRVYLIGGHIGVAAVSTVYTAPINTDGTLGSWGTGNSLPAALHGCSVAITKNRIYVIGGASSSTAQSTVYSAIINSDGLIGSWNTEPSFPVNNYNANIYISKNIVYIIGGSPTNSTAVTANVYRSNIKPDGTLGPWVLGTSLPAGFCQSSLFFVKNRIYLLGGYNGVSVLSSVYTAIISDSLNDYSPYYDGTVVPFEPVNPTTTFKLPDMSATDVNGIYHYIKY